MTNENEIAEAPNPLWQPLNERHLDGTWWRAPMAREMLTLRNASGELWGAAGMRDRQNSIEWIEKMAFGWENEDEDFLPQGAVNFWHWASVRFTAWKKRNGLE